MKIAGKQIKNPNIVVIALPREEGDDMIFKAGPVNSFDEFDKMYPEPTPPVRIGPQGVRTKDYNSPAFKAQLMLRMQSRTNWMILKSLELTPGLEWETVDMSKPETWPNYEKELRDAGLAELEVSRIVRGVLAANSLDEEKVEAARESFLLRQREAAEGSISSEDGQTSTPLGEPANA